MPLGISHQPSTERLFAWLAIAAIAYHGLSMVLLHGLASEIDPLTEQVSAYLATQFSLISRSTFLAFAVALASLGLGLRSHIPRGVLSTIGVGLLAGAIVGFLGVAAAPQVARFFGIPTQPATVLAISSLSIVLRRQRRWQPVAILLMTISALLIVLYIVTMGLGILVAMGLGGLANRIAVMLIYTWSGRSSWTLCGQEPR